jgi:hypothetical protein
MESQTKFRTLNKTRILFWGIQRSGNHALINWIFEQYEEPKMFLNHQIFGEELKASPTRSLASLSSELSEAPKVVYSQKGKQDWQSIWNNPEHGLNECLIVSFENHDISKISSAQYLDGCQLIDGSVVRASENTINVVLLRDPFNMWMSYSPETGKPHDPYLWKVYAKEYLGITNFLPNKVCVSFNQWFSDQDYRKSLSRALGVPFSDKGLNKVSRYGGGSNFDGTKYDGTAQKMNVLNRWGQSRNFLKKRQLLKVLHKDEEMGNLVQTIFPDLNQKWNKPTISNFWYHL